MTSDEAKKRIELLPDFVYSKRFGNSLAQVLERYPDGVPDKVIASVLLMTEEEVADTYDNVVKKLKKIMKVEA